MKQERKACGSRVAIALAGLGLCMVVWLLTQKGEREPSNSANQPSIPTNALPSTAALVTPAASASTRTSGAALSGIPVANTGGAALPEHVQTWLRERLTPESFVAGIALLKDASLSEQARLLVLDKLHSWRRHLTPENLKDLFAETELLAKDANLAKDHRARTVNAVATILVVLQEQNLFTRQDVESYFPFLTELSQDRDADVLVRGRAIRALGILKAESAGPAIRELLAAPENLSNQELARNACLALVQVDGSAAVPLISHVLENTADEAVFGTAAFSLGQIQTPESLAALVRNESRFPNSGSADAALVNMEDVILRVLGQPNDPNLVAAIEATRHLWKDGQRERYAPVLRSLLENSPVAAQQAAVSRLIEDSRGLPLELEQQALAAVQPAVANNPQLAAYAKQIQARLDAKPLVPNAPAIPTPR